MIRFLNVEDAKAALIYDNRHLDDSLIKGKNYYKTTCILVRSATFDDWQAATADAQK